MKYPKPLLDLIDCFAMYPGIGPKTAERLAFFTLQKMTKENVIKFSDQLKSAIENIQKCEVCGMISESSKCSICSDNERAKTILIVESSKDVNVFEQTNQYHGKYHILNGLISPLKGIGPDSIDISSLKKRIVEEGITEVIIATSSTLDGEMTAMYIKGLLDDVTTVYRIGYGLPAGADIEYADEMTLLRALESKKMM